MIWPFKRKPKPLNPGPINEDWAVGDLAECIGGKWHLDGEGPTDGPENGDVHKVVGVSPRRTQELGDEWFLRLAGWPGDFFAARAFRKVPPLNSAADAEFTAQIKSLKPKRVRA